MLLCAQLQQGNFPLACNRSCELTCACPAAGACRVADVQLVLGSSSSSDGDPGSLLLLSAGNDGELCLWDLGRAAETGSGGRGGGLMPQCLARSTDLHAGGCMHNLLAGCQLDPYTTVVQMCSRPCTATCLLFCPGHELPPLPLLLPPARRHLLASGAQRPHPDCIQGRHCGHQQPGRQQRYRQPGGGTAVRGPARWSGQVRPLARWRHLCIVRQRPPVVCGGRTAAAQRRCASLAWVQRGRELTKAAS